MAGKKTNGHTYVAPKYRAYKYRGDRDPAMDDIHSIQANEGLSDHQLHIMSGVSMSTLKNWGPRGKTFRPTHACLAAVFGAMGWEYVLQQRRKINVDEEMIEGQRWLDRQKKLKERQQE